MRFKSVGFNRYIHVSQLLACESHESRQMEAAARVACLTAERDFNVVKFHGEFDRISLLDYPGFFDEAFPTLARYWVVDVSLETVRHRSLSSSKNQPVLHRKELLLEPEHPLAEKFSQTTLLAERLGLFNDPARIGLKLAWIRKIANAGFEVVGNELIPLSNASLEHFDDVDDPVLDDEVEILRHRTALSRTSLSAPLQSAVRLGLLTKDSSVFDYGCGRGGDLERLREAGINATGWDPFFQPNAEITEAEIVNLGFVLNVIESIEERTLALKRSFELAKKVLIVGVMSSSAVSGKHASFKDGVVTSRRTFQKYYSQEELIDYLEGILGSRAFPIAPGICLVFKCKESEYNFMRGSLREPKRRLRPVLAGVKLSRDHQRRHITEVDREFIANIVALWTSRGRPPSEAEYPSKVGSIDYTIRSISQAVRLASELYPESLAEAKLSEKKFRDDLMTITACHGHLNLSSLRSISNEDIRYHFGSKAKLVEATREAISHAGEPASLYAICQQTSAEGIGYLDEEDRYWISAERVDDLPVSLRIFIRLSCASIGEISMFDLVKLSIRSQKITLLHCESMLDGPFIGRGEGFKLNLRSGRIEQVLVSPTILDALPKSQLLGVGHALWSAQLAFEEATRDYVRRDTRPGPFSADSLHSILRARRYTIEGFNLERCTENPSLDEPCGSHFTFRDFVECGETQVRLKVSNVPSQPETYNALADLCAYILDPVVEYFGSIKLSYGVSCWDLTRHIKSRIAPKLDQHASFERNSRGARICARGGAAVDFIVEDEDMREVADWIIKNTSFDRLYFYGSDRPIHVSFSTAHSRLAYQMKRARNGSLIPSSFKSNPPNE